MTMRHLHDSTPDGLHGLQHTRWIASSLSLSLSLSCSTQDGLHQAKWSRQGHGAHKWCRQGQTRQGYAALSCDRLDKDMEHTKGVDKDMEHTISAMMQHAKAKGGRSAAALSPTLPRQIGPLTSGHLCRALNCVRDPTLMSMVQFGWCSAASRGLSRRDSFIFATWRMHM